MVNDNDRRIEETLAKFGEPVAGSIWRVQGNAVIYHKALERIATRAKIKFERPTLIRADRDEAVMLVVGEMGERTEWSIGEALVGVNYRVAGKQAAYVYAMAEKRAKDRVILKLIELHGILYSEEEADEFKAGKPNGQVEDERTQFKSMADVLIDEIEKRDPAKLSRLITHPAFMKDYEQLDNYDKDRVDAAYKARKVPVE